MLILYICILNELIRARKENIFLNCVYKKNNNIILNYLILLDKKCCFKNKINNEKYISIS